jgi:FHS family glucose/mannose:H+ symporter-like MFS transporter
MIIRSGSAGKTAPDRWASSSLVLGAGFGFTGAGTIMLGVLLPTLSKNWGLRDDAVGFLFFLQFLGSSLGAVLTGANRVRSLLTGYGLLVASACVLSFAEVRLSFAAFFFFGLGLGMAMTATSLLFSDRYGDDRAAKLERINFAWSAGATAAPVILLAMVNALKLRLFFLSLEGMFLPLFLWVLLVERKDGLHAADAEPEWQGSGSQLRFLLPLVTLAMCSVGVESALSGWLTTYSHRASPFATGGPALSTSIFWFGSTFSRLVFSTSLLARIGRHKVLTGALWVVAGSVALLIVAHHVSAIRIAAGLAGLSIGPLYPLLLSFMLERTPRGWIFAVAGLGSAFFPWLTGLISAHYGSLRYGLIAPCGAAILMIVLRSTSLRAGASDSPVEQG